MKTADEKKNAASAFSNAPRSPTCNAMTIINQLGLSCGMKAVRIDPKNNTAFGFVIMTKYAVRNGALVAGDFASALKRNMPPCRTERKAFIPR